MEKLIYDQSQKPYLINGVQLQIEAVKKQLNELYAILAQLDSSLVDGNFFQSQEYNENEKTKPNRRVYAPRETKDGGKDYFIKVKKVLELEGKSLTTREILKLLYEYYPEEFNEDDDRKNIASLSAILTEKTAEEKIFRDKPSVGHARFYLAKKHNLEEKSDKEDIQLTNNNDDIIWETEKVDIDEDDLPF